MIWWSIAVGVAYGLFGAGFSAQFMRTNYDPKQRLAYAVCFVIAAVIWLPCLMICAGAFAARKGMIR